MPASNFAAHNQLIEASRYAVKEQRNTPEDQNPLDGQELLDGFCNDTLSEDQRNAFKALLMSDPALLEAYWSRMAVEAELYACHAASMDINIDTLSEESAPQTSQPSTSVAAAQGRNWGGLLTIAASLLLVAGLSSWATRSLTLSATPRVAAADTSNQNVVPAPGAVAARVTATRNCRWSDPGVGAGYGVTINVGQRLELLAGVSEITFGSGAKLLLEGPAVLDVESPQSVELLSGQLSAVVPDGGSVLRVRTATLGVQEILPTGSGGAAALATAEYGLIAQPGGGAEVHVFHGDVRAMLVDNRGQPLRSVALAPTEAAKVFPASTTVAKFHANNSRFVRSIHPTGGPQNGLFAYEGFDYPAGPLALQNGGFGWGGPWVDIESASSIDAPATNRVDVGSLASEGMVAVGNRTLQSAQRNRIRRALSTSLGGVFDSAGLVENRDGHRIVGKDGKTVYLSFIQRVDRTDDVFYGFELNRGDGNANRVLCIGNGADGAGYGVTSNLNAYGAANYPQLGVENTEANLIVVKIEFGPGDRDHVTVYRNPESLLDEADCQADALLKGNFAFDRISLGNFDGTKHHEVDEVRIGAAFRAVTGQRDPLPERFESPIATVIQPPIISHTRNKRSLYSTPTTLTTAFISRR